MFIVIYRAHGQLNMETAHIGPFSTHEEAYDYLCMLPALGICPEGENVGCKYTKELIVPDMELANDLAACMVQGANMQS